MTQHSLKDSGVVTSPPQQTPRISIYEKVRNLIKWLASHTKGPSFALGVLVFVVLLSMPVGWYAFNQWTCQMTVSLGRCTHPVTDVSQIPSGSFVALGANTFAAQQSTSTGRTIAALMPWQGKIYMGYGDYGANTGPIHVMYYDPTTGNINDSINPDGTPFLSSTEAIYNFRAINGALYGLAMDPKGSQCGFMYAKTTDGVHWQDVKGLLPAPTSCPPSTTGNWVDAEHVMDMGTMDGTDLWTAGSSLGKVNVNGTMTQGLSGAIWRSTDNGATWTKMLEVQPMDYLTNSNDYTRFYSLGALGGKMYVEAWDVAANAHQPCQAYDGTSWTACPEMMPSYGGGWRPITFNGKLVFRASEPPSASTVAYYDGVTLKTTNISAYDIAVDDQSKTLYATTYGGVYATTDLKNWTLLNIANTPVAPHSIAVLNNILYIGTSDSQLLATSLATPIGPGVRLSDNVSSGSAPLAVNLYASGTGGTSPITNYHVNFGDGTSNDSPGAPSLNHTYSQPGTYTATVTATDSNGLSANASQTITVTPVAPTAALNVTPVLGIAALTVTADASASTAGTYPIADYMFDFGDGTIVGPQVSPTASHIYTKAGGYTIAVTVRDTSGRTSTQTKSVTALLPLPMYVGQYFANTTLSGTPVLSRRDPSINFNWGTGSPGTGVPVDKFSVRWTRTVPLDAGTYKFTVTVDDGVRLYVDGALIINQWKGESATTYTVSRALAAGNHTIIMEYFDYTGSAVARMSYSLISRAADVYQGQYFANNALRGTPALVRNDAAINFNWAAAAPATGLPTDNFSVRWVGVPYFNAGTYRFQTVADDGVRLYVDNQLLVDRWTTGLATNYGYKTLTAGYHTIRMEYYEGTGNAQAQLSYYLFDLGTGAYEGSYWNTTGLSGSPTLTRADAAITFSWGTGSPASSIHVDNFSARWTKIATFAAGSHTFTTTTDDGVRLYIDDQLLINQWKGEPPTTYKVTKTLTAGTHTIRMEYFEGASGATAKFSYN